MFSSIEECRKLLVDDWSVVALDEWNRLVVQHQTPEAIVDFLCGRNRFLLMRFPLAFITPEMRTAIQSGSANDLVVTIGEHRWLKMKPLNHGGQGEVWIATPCHATAKARQLVVVKSPKKPPNTTAGISIREIESLRQIKHGNVVKLVAADVNSGVLVTRLVDGLSLEEKVKQERRLSVSQVIRIGIDACKALQTLHDLTFIHKDVKPGNLVLDRNGRTILIDLGLAEIPNPSHHRAEGTPYYIAPEVFVAESAPDARADVYSLAATMYRLLASQPPYFHQCLNPRDFKSLRADLDLLRFLRSDALLECNLEDIRRDVPRELCDLLCRALSADRANRPATADGFRAALEAMETKLLEAVAIEKELWQFADLLLETVREINRDPKYLGQEKKNAISIQKNLERMLRRFSALGKLKLSRDRWQDFLTILAILGPAAKVVSHVEALIRQLDEFLEKPIAPLHPEISSRLLNELVVRTLEGIRQCSVSAFAAAHDWRSAIQQLGLLDAPAIDEADIPRIDSLPDEPLGTTQSFN